jgi:hypothetical protein
VLELKVFITKRVSVNALSTHTIVMRKIPTLYHESRNDSMKATSLVRKSLRANGLVSPAQAFKVFDRLGDHVSVQSHDDATCRFIIDIDIEKDP